MSGHHGGGPLKFILVESPVAIGVMVCGLFQDGLSVGDTGLVHGFGQMLVFPRGRWRWTFGGQIRLNGLTAEATASDVKQFWVVRVMRQGPRGHGPGSVGVAHAFEQHGEVCGGRCVVWFEVKTNGERLLGAFGVALSFKKHAAVVPGHGT